MSPCGTQRARTAFVYATLRGFVYVSLWHSQRARTAFVYATLMVFVYVTLWQPAGSHGFAGLRLLAARAASHVATGTTAPQAPPVASRREGCPPAARARRSGVGELR